MRKFNPNIISFNSFDGEKINEADSKSLNSTEGLYKLNASLNILLKNGKAYTSFNPGSSIIKDETKLVVQIDDITKETTNPSFLFLTKISGGSLKSKNLFRIDSIISENEDSKKIEGSVIMLDPAITIEQGGVFPIVAIDPNKDGFFKEKEDLNDFQWWAKTKDYVDWLKSEGKELEDKLSESIDPHSYPGNPEFEIADIEDFFSPELWMSGEIDDQYFTSESFRHFILGTSMINRNFVEVNDGKIYEQTEEGFVKFDTKKFTSEWFYGNVLAREASKTYEDYWIEIGNEYKKILRSLIEETLAVNEEEGSEKEVGKEKEDGGSSLESTTSFVGGMGAYWLGSKILSSLYNGARKIVKRSSIPSQTREAEVENIRSVYRNLPTSSSTNSRIGRTYSPTANRQVGMAKRVKEIAGAMTRGAAAIGKREAAQRLGQPLLRAAVGSEKASKAIRASRVLAAGRTVAGGTEAAAAVGASAAATGALIVGSIIALQRTYNWMSDKQAPRYSDVKEFAIGHFDPSEISSGEIVTLCWTQEQSAGLGDFMMLSNDSRTTMTMMKIITTEDHYIFQVLTSQSKNFAKLLENPNSMFLVRFNKNIDIKRGILDNQDIPYSSAYIDNIGDYTIPAIFNMWALSSDVDLTIGKVGPMISIFDNAPGEYLFNFKSESGRINVKGNLIKVSEMKPEDMGMKADPGFFVKTMKFVTGIFESSSVSDFKSFNRINENEPILKWNDYINEEKTSVDLKPYRFAAYRIDISKDLDDNNYDMPNDVFYIFDEYSIKAKDGQPIACGYYVDQGKTSNYKDSRRGWAKKSAEESEGDDGNSEGGNSGGGNSGGRDGKDGKGGKEKDGSWKQWDSESDEGKGERYSGIRHKERGEVPKDKGSDIAGNSKILKVTDPSNDDIDLWNGSELNNKEKYKFEEVKKAVNMDGPPWTKVGFYKVVKDEEGHPVKVIFNTRKDRLGERKVFRDGKSPAFDDSIKLVRWLEYQREKVKYPDTKIPSDLMKN